MAYMKSHRAILIVMLALPGVAAAQRSQTPGRDGRPTLSRPADPPEFKAGDLESLNPARIALMQTDLGLNPEQSRRLDSIALAFESKAKSLRTGLDTLQSIVTRGRRDAFYEARNRAMSRPRDRPTSAQDSIERARDDSVDQVKSDKQRERVMAARNGLSAILLAVRDDYDRYIISINGVLADTQRTKLGPRLEAASEELTTRLHWANSR